MGTVVALLILVAVVPVLTVVPSWLRRKRSRANDDDLWRPNRDQAGEKVTGDQIEAARDFTYYRDIKADWLG
jgi:hypothetical protein